MTGWRRWQGRCSNNNNEPCHSSKTMIFVDDGSDDDSPTQTRDYHKEKKERKIITTNVCIPCTRTYPKCALPWTKETKQQQKLTYSHPHRQEENSQSMAGSYYEKENLVSDFQCIRNVYKDIGITKRTHTHTTIVTKTREKPVAFAITRILGNENPH